MEHPQGEGGRRIGGEAAKRRGSGSASGIRTPARWAELLPPLLAPLVPKCPLCLAPVAAEMLKGMEEGWSGSLDRLAALLR